MAINKERQERQLACISKWEQNGYKGIIDAYPGVGKTHIAVLAMSAVGKIKEHSILVVVPSAALKVQWETTLSSCTGKRHRKILRVETIHTIMSSPAQWMCDMLVIDEVHEFHTTEKQQVLNGTKVVFTKILGLTGSADDKNFYKVTKLLPVVDIISEEEARDKHYIAESIEYNLGLEFTEKEQEQYDKLSEVINTHMKYFSKNLSYAIAVIQGGIYSNGIYYSGPGWARGIATSFGWHENMDLTVPGNYDIEQEYNPSKIIGYAQKLMLAVRKRKELLQNATAKYEVVPTLIDKFNNVKTIVFSESTTYADKIGKILNNNNHVAVVYHSKLQTIMAPSLKTGKIVKKGQGTLKKEALEAIVNGTAKVLCTATALDRGLNIPDLRFSITASGTQNATQFKQRSNRVTRKESRNNKPVLSITLYIKGTQEEKWVNSRQANSTTLILDIDSIDDITYSPPANKDLKLF